MFTSIVIPVYNESSCLEKNLETVHAFLTERFSERHEIVCVDDGSRDDSLAILNRCKERLPLSVQFNGSNQGKGAAIRTGMLASRGEVVFFSDADLSTPLDEMDRFLPRFDEGYDVVIGTRKSPDARIKKYQPLHRVLMGLGYTYWVNFMLGLRISDYTCGFKAFTRKAVEAIFPKTRIDGWSFDAEILYVAKLCGLTLCEVPVTWENQPGSKVRLIRDTIRSFSEVLRIRKIHRSGNA